MKIIYYVLFCFLSVCKLCKVNLFLVELGFLQLGVRLKHYRIAPNITTISTSIFFSECQTLFFDQRAEESMLRWTFKIHILYQLWLSLKMLCMHLYLLTVFTVQMEVFFFIKFKFSEKNVYAWLSWRCILVSRCAAFWSCLEHNLPGNWLGLMTP